MAESLQLSLLNNCLHCLRQAFPENSANFMHRGDGTPGKAIAVIVQIVDVLEDLLDQLSAHLDSDRKYVAKLPEKRGEELFEDLRLLYSAAVIDDYCKHGVWNDDLMRTDYVLLEANSKRAAAVRKSLGLLESVTKSTIREATPKSMAELRSEIPELSHNIPAPSTPPLRKTAPPLAMPQVLTGAQIMAIPRRLPRCLRERCFQVKEETQNAQSGVRQMETPEPIPRTKRVSDSSKSAARGQDLSTHLVKSQQKKRPLVTEGQNQYPRKRRNTGTQKNRDDSWQRAEA